MNTNSNTQNTPKVGRPKAELKYPRGIFTVMDLYELNRGPRGRGLKAKVCTLTVRKHIEAELASGFLTQVRNVKSGRVGKPAAQFIRTAVWAGRRTAVAKRKSVPEVSLVPTAPAISPEAQTPVTETVSAAS